MREHKYDVAGDRVSIFQVEHPDDLDEFEGFVYENRKRLSFDTETTSLNQYEPGFRCRLAQFGNQHEAFVLPVELGAVYVNAAVSTLNNIENIVVHNGIYDLQVAERSFGLGMEKLWPKVTDTRILAHLIDPRGPEEGGIGQGLEVLTAHYIDRDVAEEVKGLMARLAKEFKTTKSRIWSVIDLDHPEFNLYAGMDTILTARLDKLLWTKVPACSRELVEFERELAEVCSYYERSGFLLDVGYSQDLSLELAWAETEHKSRALDLGVENVNSTDQVAEALIARGVEITGRTKTGKYQVDKHLLNRLVAEGDELAVAVKEAKKAGKWRSTWVDTFLATRDEHDRCHASINPLRARTARMSISGIPAQTLPADDAMIRRCFLSDPGDSIVSVDYNSMELRVLAALCGDEVMIEAFKNDASLHMITAKTAFGPGVEKDSKEYKLSKTANFQKVYGGGASGLATQTGIDLATAKLVHEGFDKAYPKVKPYSKLLAREAEATGGIVTPTGRVLPVDRGKEYRALNYKVQSASRDVMARGLIRAHHAGFTNMIRLPIHDEALGSFPSLTAEPEAAELAHVMAEVMGPVDINCDYEVGLRSWGSLLGADY